MRFADASEYLRHFYAKCSIILVNTCLLALVLNFACWVAIRIGRRPEMSFSPVVRYGMARLLKGYPGVPEVRVSEMLRETYEEVLPGTVYEALTEFKEPPFQGTYVNIDPAGFRRGSAQGPWPPDPANFNIFVFGGSTTFGYGVTDGETIPSAIQAFASKGSRRPVFAYNFGRAGYFSTQELMLYYKLLTAGYVPDVAVFVDGLNDFLNVTVHLSGNMDSSAVLKSLVEELHWGDNFGSLRRFIVHTSLGRISGWMRGVGETRNQHNSGTERITGAMLLRTRDRWLINKRLIEAQSASFHVRPIFIWQPVPTYRYDAARYHFLRDLVEPPLAWRSPPVVGYPLMAKSRAELEGGSNFLWLADMQASKHENLYVDEFHYTASFNKEISTLICGFLNQKAILPPPKPERHFLDH